MINTSKKYISPAMIMLVVWGTDIYLYNLHIVSFYNYLNTSSLILFGGVIIALYAAGLTVSACRFELKKKGRFKIANSGLSLDFIIDKTKWVTKVFVYGTIINILFCGGFPLLWLFNGDGRTYTEFGVPSLSGFLHSFYYISLVANTYIYIKTKNKHYKNIVLLLLSYPILLVQRALIFTAGFELICIYLLMRKIQWKSVLRGFFIILVVVILFGYMGDYRNGAEMKEKSEGFVREIVDERYVDVMEKLPSGFTWIYVYYSCSINNVVINIDKLNPTYSPVNTIKRLFPSAISRIIFREQDKDYEDRYAMEMDNSVFNVFTMYTHLLTDFGLYLTIAFYFFAGIFFYNVYYRASENDIKNMFMYPPIFMVLCLSVFDDFLISLPTLFQFILTYNIFKVKKNSVQKYIAAEESINNR